MLFDLVIENAACVNADSRFRAHLGIHDGKIAAISTTSLKGRKTVDATPYLVLPGGVEVHCHLEQRSSQGVMTADDFHTGSVSAACGGNTTIVPFICQHKGEQLAEVYERAVESAARKCVVDYAFHLIITDPGVKNFESDLEKIVEDGTKSFKVFLTYDLMRVSDEEFLALLDYARDRGLVVMVHAESGAILKHLTHKLLERGNIEPRYHSTSRPPVVESEAVNRALSFGEVIGAPIYIVHVSSGAALDEIRNFRARGIEVIGETCPQYLLLTEQDLERPGVCAFKFMCSPPPRDASSHEAIWRGIQSGFDVFSSDHAPYRLNDPKGKLIAGEDAPFSKIPNGVPGIETRLPLLFSEGVMAGRIDIHRFVALTSTNAAKIFGMFPRKGTIAVGADADLVLWDPQENWIIRNDDLHHAVDYTPYEGREINGRIVAVYSRGECVASDGDCHSEPGRGEYIPREPYSAAAPNLSGNALDPFMGRPMIPQF